MTHGPVDLVRPLDTTWIASATCGRLPSLPWTDNPQRVPEVVLEIMRGVCARCPVLEDCAAFVEDGHVTAGFWAGSSRDHLEVGDYHRHEGGEAA